MHYLVTFHPNVLKRAATTTNSHIIFNVTEHFLLFVLKVVNFTDHLPITVNCRLADTWPGTCRISYARMQVPDVTGSVINKTVDARLAQQ